MASHVRLEMAEMDSGTAYDILVACVQPRPIAFVSTISSEGITNLAPFSFFMVGGSNPPSLCFSPTLTRYGAKDTLRNIRETGEFVVNLVHREMAEAMNLTSARLPAGHSEWELGGLTPVESSRVRPPRVLQSLVHFECRLFNVVSHGDDVGSAQYVIGEVIVAHVSDDAWDGQRIVPSRLRPIARMGGSEYIDPDSLELFRLERPT